MMVLALNWLFLIPITAQQSSIDILVIYSEPEEGNVFSSFFQDLNVNIDLLETENETPGSFANYELIIIADSNGEIDGAIRDSLDNYITSTSFKALITITSETDQFSGDLRRFLGVENYLKEVGDEETGWQIDFNGTQVSYKGEMALIEPTLDASILGTILSTNDSSLQTEITGNEPIILERNSSTYYSLTFAFDYQSGDEQNTAHRQGFFLAGLSDLLKAKIKELLTLRLNQFQSILGTSLITNPVHTTTNSSISDSNVNPLPSELPQLNVPSPLISLLIVLGLIGLFFRQIISFFKWLIERIWVLTVFVIASIYQPENRQLTEGQLLMNPVRRAILEYLEFMGSSGAHLREIKKAVDVGMGNLLWHLEILEDYGWIEKRKIGRYNVYIASEFISDFDENLKGAELELRSKHAITFLEYLLSYDDIDWNISLISKEIGVNRKSIRKMLKTLKKYNLIWAGPRNPDKIKVNYASIERILDSLLKSSQFTKGENIPSIK